MSHSNQDYLMIICQKFVLHNIFFSSKTTCTKGNEITGFWYQYDNVYNKCDPSVFETERAL